MYELLRSKIVRAIADRPHAFTVCLGLLISSVVLIYNGLVDVPESTRDGTEPVVVACLMAGLLGLPLVGWIWKGHINDSRLLEGAVFLGLAAALGVTLWTEYLWPDFALGTIGYTMLVFVGSGALLRNEFLLGGFLITGIVGWYLVEAGNPGGQHLPTDSHTLILASAVIAVAFHVSLRFERHVQADLTRQLVDQIHNDALTRVLNREGMLRLMESRNPSSDTPPWCLYADIDFFKSINDEFGHDRGDEVLCAVADAISRNLGPGARVARWGGDEFVAIGEGDPPSELEIEARINQELEVFPPGPQVTIGIAALIAAGDPSKSTDPVLAIEEMVKSSDRRMYARRNELRDGTRSRAGRNH